MRAFGKVLATSAAFIGAIVLWAGAASAESVSGEPPIVVACSGKDLGTKCEAGGAPGLCVRPVPSRPAYCQVERGQRKPMKNPKPKAIGKKGT